VSGTPDKRAHLAQLHAIGDEHLYSYDDYDRMVDDPAIDVVYVCLPNSMHPEYTIRALQAGKHVLCEKPMANTPAECEAMIAAAREAGRKLMIAYRLRYEPYNQALIELARDSEAMGPTRIVEAGAGFPIGDPGQWRLRKAMAGGGSLMDIGIYALNATRYLTGEEPVEVEAQLHSTPGDPRFAEVEENINFQLRFPSGILANCISSYGVGINHFDVYKPGGSAGLSPALSYGGLRMHVRRGGSVEERPQRVVDHFGAEIDHFSGCIADGSEPLTPGEEGLRDLRIMMAIYEAAREGRPVRLSGGA
jgi:glucose-fructose oxidoreductase